MTRRQSRIRHDTSLRRLRIMRRAAGFVGGRVRSLFLYLFYFCLLVVCYARVSLMSPFLSVVEYSRWALSFIYFRTSTSKMSKLHPRHSTDQPQLSFLFTRLDRRPGVEKKKTKHSQEFSRELCSLFLIGSTSVYV